MQKILDEAISAFDGLRRLNVIRALCAINCIGSHILYVKKRFSGSLLSLFLRNPSIRDSPTLPISSRFPSGYILPNRRICFFLGLALGQPLTTGTGTRGRPRRNKEPFKRVGPSSPPLSFRTSVGLPTLPPRPRWHWFRHSLPASSFCTVWISDSCSPRSPRTVFIHP